MEIKNTYEHIVTKEMSIRKYLKAKTPKHYEVVKTSLNIPKRCVQVVYSNKKPVYVNEQKEFGMVIMRERVIEIGKYSSLSYISKESKNMPSIPSWATLTGYVIELNEWCSAYEYINKVPMLVQEEFNPDTKTYEIKKMEPLNKEQILQRSRK